MHTAAKHRGRGVGLAILKQIVAEARARGYRRLSLETGSMAAFAPARALYAGFGFTECAAFRRLQARSEQRVHDVGPDGERSRRADRLARAVSPNISRKRLWLLALLAVRKERTWARSRTLPSS